MFDCADVRRRYARHVATHDEGPLDTCSFTTARARATARPTPSLSSSARRNPGARGNGDYVIQTQTSSTLRGSCDNLGGSTAMTRGIPSVLSVQFTLARSGCDPGSYDLVVQDSRPQSPFNFSAVATRCRCDIGWAPCEQALPTYFLRALAQGAMSNASAATHRRGGALSADRRRRHDLACQRPRCERPGRSWSSRRSSNRPAR